MISTMVESEECLTRIDTAATLRARCAEERGCWSKAAGQRPTVKLCWYVLCLCFALWIEAFTLDEKCSGHTCKSAGDSECGAGGSTARGLEQC